MAGSTNELYRKEIERLAIESAIPGLFLRRASVLREAGKYEEAILEVKEGLQKYPGNPAAYYFLIILFLDLKKPKQAEITLHSASKYFSVNELTAWYRELISEVQIEIEGAKRAEEEAISRFQITDDTSEEPAQFDPGHPVSEDLMEETPIDAADEVEEEIPVQEDFEIDEDKTGIPLAEYSPDEETVVDEQPDEPELDEYPVEDQDSEIVTAGMAIIHARQGNTEKAIEIFKKLIEKEPEKRESYEKIIQLLNSKITDK